MELLDFFLKSSFEGDWNILEWFGAAPAFLPQVESSEQGIGPGNIPHPKGNSFFYPSLGAVQLIPVVPVKPVTPRR